MPALPLVQQLGLPRGGNLPELQAAAKVMAPSVSGQVLWQVTAVEARPECWLKVRFCDGTEGIVDMQARVHSPDAGVFAVLADPQRFAEVFVEYEVVI